MLSDKLAGGVGCVDNLADHSRGRTQFEIPKPEPQETKTNSGGPHGKPSTVEAKLNLAWLSGLYSVLSNRDCDKGTEERKRFRTNWFAGSCSAGGGDRYLRTNKQGPKENGGKSESTAHPCMVQQSQLGQAIEAPWTLSNGPQKLLSSHRGPFLARLEGAIPLPISNPLEP
jgi:hypothetical protein